MNQQAINEIAFEARKELARRDFFEFCNMLMPKFYMRDRAYLIELCDELQAFIDSDDDILLINEPPRHGKSLTATQFVKFLFGRDINKKIMTGSYNERLSTSFSKAVRNGIQEIKADEDKIVYGDIFPATNVKRGDAGMNLWSLEGGHNNYLATSPGGTATGFGADYIIIDDLIKSAEEANNANELDKHWDWFVNTMLSRLEENGKIIIIMTRWHSQDLAGRALTELSDIGYKIKHISMKALQDDGTMLCESVLSKESYLKKTAAMGEDIAAANYQQEPIDIKGKLYSGFKTYEASDIPAFKRVFSYTDTADDGSDYLSTFIGGETFDSDVYILDVLYTKDPMEITAPLLAQKMIDNNVNLSVIESNNGGKGFSRDVERIAKKEMNWRKTVFKWFHQSSNKQARIYSNAFWVTENIYFPVGWRNKWPEVYKALTTYQKEGKNKNDDAPDALTGVAETIANKQKLRTINKRSLGL